jgi:hypothetical protein
MNKERNVTRTGQKIPAYMAVIATVAIIATGPMSTMAMAQYNGTDGNQGPDWNGICNQIQSILVESCDQLVNSDGSFTSDGQRAHDCIQNGILLGTGAFFLLGGNPGTLPLIISGLKTLSSQTGCDNIVNWDSLNSSQLSLLMNIFHH